jgi:hypothetical protein
MYEPSISFPNDDQLRTMKPGRKLVKSPKLKPMGLNSEAKSKFRLQFPFENIKPDFSEDICDLQSKDCSGKEKLSLEKIDGGRWMIGGKVLETGCSCNHLEDRSRHAGGARCW